MRYLDVCAGISASTVAWKPLGWMAAAYSEIEPAPRSILAHHYPDTPLHGDFTTIRGDEYGAIDLLVGGTPCQDFSVAGLRAGLDGDRGNLSLEYLRLADRARPRWLVWENVPGVLSIDGGRAFGAILGGLGELGYGFAYRILDAQHFGVPQRRRRVFVVGHLGDWRRAAAVLFERHSLSGHPAPRRETREGVAGATPPCTRTGGDVVGALNTANGKTRPGDTLQCALAGHMLAYGGNNCSGPVNVAASLQAHPGPAGRMDFASETFISFDTTQITSPNNRSNPQPNGLCHALAAGAHPPAIAYRSSGNCGAWETGDRTDALTSANDMAAQHLIAFDVDNSAGAPNSVETFGTLSTTRSLGVMQSAVRRLTPRECERLQGFPDDYTLVPHRGKSMADGPRYKALGNSMAVPVMRWIGERIQHVDALPFADRLAA